MRPSPHPPGASYRGRRRRPLRGGSDGARGSGHAEAARRSRQRHRRHDRRPDSNTWRHARGSRPGARRASGRIRSGHAAVRPCPSGAGGTVRAGDTHIPARRAGMAAALHVYHRLRDITAPTHEEVVHRSTWHETSSGSSAALLRPAKKSCTGRYGTRRPFNVHGSQHLPETSSEHSGHVRFNVFAAPSVHNQKPEPLDFTQKASSISPLRLPHQEPLEWPT